jgi:hypothetical protein
VYVYGVVRAKGRPPLGGEGVEGRPLALIDHGDLAAIVSDVPADDAKATRDQALAHARVLEAAVEDAAVVPLKFGTVCPGDEQVGKGLLEERHDELAEILKRVEGHVQMTLKVTYHEDAVLREIMDSEPQIAELRKQSQGPEEQTRNLKVQLGELISKALEQRREADKADIFEQLKPVSVAAVDDPVETEFMVLNAPFLVERDRLDDFEEGVEQVAEERHQRMQFTLQGPMPAYNFLDVDEPAWA